MELNPSLTTGHDHDNKMSHDEGHPKSFPAHLKTLKMQIALNDWWKSLKSTRFSKTREHQGQTIPSDMQADLQIILFHSLCNVHVTMVYDSLTLSY